MCFSVVSLLIKTLLISNNSLFEKSAPLRSTPIYFVAFAEIYSLNITEIASIYLLFEVSSVNFILLKSYVVKYSNKSSTVI